MADNRIADIDPEKVKKIVAELREMPERLDKEMRKELRAVSKDLVAPARAEAMAARPPRTSPKFADGAYHWSTLVNTIRSGADADTPYMVFGSDKVPGWPGHVFGSDRGNFRPRLGRNANEAKGYFFFTTIDDRADSIERDTMHIVDKYARVAEGE